MPRKKSPIVEVAVPSDDGRVAVGIMNAEQALELSEEVKVEVSHPDHKAGETDVFIPAEELRDHPAVAKPRARTAKVRGLEKAEALREHLTAVEADAPADEDAPLIDDEPSDVEASLQQLRDEIDNLKSRLQVIREQAGTVVSENAKWADASAHAQLGAYPWAKLAGAMAFTFVATRLLRRLPLGAAASAALPIAAAEMRRRYGR